MTRYLVPGGAHTISLRKDGYTTWTGSYSLKWPQVRYFGQIKLKSEPESSSKTGVHYGGVANGILMTGMTGEQNPHGIIPGIEIKSDNGNGEGIIVPDLIPTSVPSI